MSSHTVKVKRAANTVYKRKVWSGEKELGSREEKKQEEQIDISVKRVNRTARGAQQEQKC